MKLLISILATKKQPWWNVLQQGIYETWAKTSLPNVKIIHYVGDPNINSTQLNGNELVLPTECIDYVKKTAESYKFISENFDFDYLFRTNVSTYIRVDKLLEYLKDKPKYNFYAGREAILGNLLYASGASSLYSKDIIDFFASKSNELNGHPDDVAYGKLLKKYRYEMEIIKSINDFQDVNFYYIKDKIDHDAFLFRCKTNRNKGVKILNHDVMDIRKYDIKKMKYLHEYFNY